jgi:IS30 family transposase
MTKSQVTTPRHYRQLTLDERGQIQALKQAGFTVTQVTEQVHRDKSIIIRELRHGKTEQIRSTGYCRYFAETGTAVYEKHLGARSTTNVPPSST